MVVAIHDVAPQWLDDVRFVVEALDKLRVRPRVHKVIPRDLLASSELLRMLREEQEQGSEIVLHGYSHRSSGRWHGPWRRRVRAMLVARYDAEFLTLPPADMEARLVDGQAVLRRAGLVAAGFCAPGWLESPDLAPILRRLGFRYDIRMTHVVELSNGRRIWTDWLGYMGAGRMQERFVRVANAINKQARGAFPVVKLFIHPQGARRSTACRRVLDLIPGLMRERTLATYGQLIPE